MGTETRRGTKADLEIALAQGISIREWARANNVPRSTAHRWAAKPEVRQAVESIRRRSRNRAVSRLTQSANWTFNRVMDLASDAKSENVRFKALHDIIANLMASAGNAELEARVARLEERV